MKITVLEWVSEWVRVSIPPDSSPSKTWQEPMSQATDARLRTNSKTHRRVNYAQNCTYGSMRGIRRKTAKSVLRVVEDRAGVPHGASRFTLHPYLLLKREDGTTVGAVKTEVIKSGSPDWSDSKTISLISVGR